MIKTIIKKIIRKTALNSLFVPPVIRQKYYFKLFQKKGKPGIIFALDASVSPAGLTDVLVGIISSFAYSKYKEMPFYIDFNNPFRFEDYLEPNSYNWSLPTNVRTNNLMHTRVICMMDHGEADILEYPLEKQRQYHLYTNINFIDNVNQKSNKHYTFPQLYNELFKPSKSLKQLIEREIGIIGGDFISVSFRFTTLLGDFDDSINAPLPIDEQERVIERSICMLKELHNKYEKKKMFVTADSEKFTERLKSIDYIYTISGKKGQFYYSPEDDVTMNTFLDFFLISHADKVFQAHTGNMYYGKFSKTAALISGAPFEIIEY